MKPIKTKNNIKNIKLILGEIVNIKKLNNNQLLFINVFCFSSFFIIIFLLINELISPIPSNIYYSKEIYSKDKELIAAFLSKDDKWRFQTKLEEVSPFLIKTILYKEDKYFNYHFGVNPLAIIKSFYQNIITKKIVTGASTITMQVIRMLEKRDRTYLNKMIEIFRAIYLEFKLDKKQILELYCSLLPYGGNIEGVNSASYIYFDKSSKNLSLSEATILSIIPNNPNKLRLDFQSNINRLLKKRNELLTKLNNDNIFLTKYINDAKGEFIESKRNSINNLIPHLSQRFRESKEIKINTFIDISIQNKVADILNSHNKNLKMQSIMNCAALVMENSTGNVVAYCGSANFNDSICEGQNDGLRALRSPGSTLKPALFAFGLDEGLITPQRIMYDVPTNFNGYEPENYDNQFYGAVSAEFALYNSLNIPAVKLLNLIGVSKFINLLKYSGFNDIAKKEKKLGLSLILGACGTNAYELAELFSSFPNKGVIRKLKFSENEKNIQANTKIFSEEAVYLISKMLSYKPERLESKILQMKQKRIPRVSWKTGTSYGKRDAWSIGYDEKYTIVVWCGNFNGKGSPYLVGGESALPILFEIFEKIGINEYNPSLPLNLELTDICKESGKLANQYCGAQDKNNIIKDYFISNSTVPEKCDLHKLRYISSDSTIYYCNSCLPKKNNLENDNLYISQIYLDYPPEYKLWLSINDKKNKEIHHNTKCQSVNYNGKLEIISPSSSYIYYLEKDANQEIALNAAGDNINEVIYWYINNEFAGKSKVFKSIFFTPKQEDCLIKCISKEGKSEEISIKIVFY